MPPGVNHFAPVLAEYPTVHRTRRCRAADSDLALRRAAALARLRRCSDQFGPLCGHGPFGKFDIYTKKDAEPEWRPVVGRVK